MLRLREVDTHYGRIQVLRAVSLEVAEGEIVCLLGGNASGKSTTMKTILGAVRPTRGTVEFEGGWVRLTPAWHTATSPNGTVHTPAGLVINELRCQAP